ncbi:equilibrative nucleobase transporter 1-like isoform X2 [Mercenaria mercenaria]|uniref:equilibrative nucleobase transporter 1-like isoform X2 n=1 Tax=Mercenaria mercenaria TaxID=6596 RepID=UPI00234F4979|nr:equilibrative nucleobase transporter 1-like isoform X2 [Mercenaria mercenaria]
MELYRKYPVVCTVWAFMEVLLFGGVIYGWGSLVFILKEEGFYSDYCTENDIGNNPDYLSPNQFPYLTLSNNSLDEKSYDVIIADDNSSTFQRITENKAINGGCSAQESQLNLWFSIAVSFMCLSFAGIGYLIRHIGTRNTRAIFFFIYLIGTLCLAFTSPEIPWLLLPGLCCIGIAGLTVYSTNLQVSNLHPHLRSTIVAILTGLFDFSSINKQIVRIAYESGIARRTSYIFISVMFAVIIATSTLFFLPKMNISEDYMKEQKRRRSSCMQEKKLVRQDDSSLQPAEKLYEELLKVHEKELGVMNGSVHLAAAGDSSKPSLLSVVFSMTYMLHLYWLFVHALRFVTFIGQLNVWLENIFDGNEAKVGEMLAIFSYMTMGAVGSALLCGFVYDYQRKRYVNAGEIKRVYFPVVLPMCLVIFYSIGTTIICYIKHEVAPYFAFVLFTLFRTSLFTVAVAFIGDAFPIDYFGVLFGFIELSAGIAGLAQYPLFQWYDGYDGSYMNVNHFLLVLEVSTVIHPILLYIKGRRDKGERSCKVYRHAYTIVVPGTA